MNPARLAEVKEKGLLEGECEGDLYGGEDGEAWRGWVSGDRLGERYGFPISEARWVGPLFVPGCGGRRRALL